MGKFELFIFKECTRSIHFGPAALHRVHYGMLGNNIYARQAGKKMEAIIIMTSLFTMHVAVATRIGRSLYCYTYSFYSTRVIRGNSQTSCSGSESLNRYIITTI